ncbi:L-lysine exporter family protein LysE/ArgO [Andreprevotia lacus DSM 23236]|jgi:L-lysine exporter family protein LysE/ArgO|uniref:L-lysine exporter family protein LysE/ArgO n=1 Tax=Andreprevotia lacus DSM 23236 TaxID=1121001 RepID=A0A1W1X9T4_9NEIS|nr:LysE/ArgO family amino acid transporter [Andreprevotia lacus]SMC20580.1 L-lysine exporter family protein LysE/ArgO [Andreprevotia lacus DSM 23236]
MFAIYLKGMALTASLIMAIGAQNAFVLRQGITRRHIFLTALTCSLCDLLLMSAGVAGMGSLLAAAPGLQRWMALAGALFVLWYGAMALRKALHPGTLAPEATQGIANPKAVVLAALGFSLLNPHALLDTIVLVGSVGAQQPAAERPLFLAGAVSFSFIWFFSLALGASKLTPLFKNPTAWRILDVLIAAMMFTIAWGLFRLV